MSAASRAALTAPARRLLVEHGGRGGWRARALGGRTDEPEAALSLSDLATLPEWLQRSVDERADLARRLAVLSMAPALAASIDGAWLGAIAARAGEPALDLALAHAGEIGAGEIAADVLPIVPTNALEARGYAVLAAASPPQLHSLIDAPAGGHEPVDGDLARRLLGLAEASGGRPSADEDDAV